MHFTNMLYLALPRVSHKHLPRKNLFVLTAQYWACDKGVTDRVERYAYHGVDIAFGNGKRTYAIALLQAFTNGGE